MKVALIVGILVGGYYYVLTHTTDLALTQLQKINTTYSYVANNADHIATGR